MERYKYLIVSIGALVLMFVQYPMLLTNVFKGKVEYSKMAEFDLNKVSGYTNDELQGFLTDSEGLMKPASIVSVAKEIAEKEGHPLSGQKSCTNCEESLLHVSKALSSTREKLEKYENKDESLPWGKISIFVLTAISTGGSFWLNGRKRDYPKKSQYYETKLDMLNLISIIVIGLIGVFC